MPTTLIYVPYFAIMERLSFDDLQKAKLGGVRIITDEEILKVFKENHQWSDFKKSFISSVLYEKNSHLAVSGITNREVNLHGRKIDIVKKTSKMLETVGQPKFIGNRYRSEQRLKLPPITKNIH